MNKTQEMSELITFQIKSLEFTLREQIQLDTDSRRFLQTKLEELKKIFKQLNPTQ